MPSTENDEQLRKDFSDIYNMYYQGWHNAITEMQTDLEMYLDAQFSRKEHAWADNEGRNLFVFNKMARQVDLLHGYEIRNRHILKIGPIGQEDDLPSRQHTGLVMNTMAMAEGYDYLSEAFRWGSLVAGQNLFEIWRDRNGNIRFNRRGHNTFLLDPMLSNTDLSDCGGIITGDWIRSDRLKMLLPANADSIDKIQPLRSTNRWRYIRNKPIGQKDDVRLYEQWWEKKTQYKTMVIDRITGTQIPFKDFVKRIMNGDARRANYFIKEFRLPNGLPGLSKYEKAFDKVTLRVFVDEQPVWSGDNPMGLDDYNFIWVAGDWCPECDRSELKLRSFARKLRDPQRARNRRMNQILDVIETQLNSWRLARQGSLVDEDMAYASGQGRLVWIKKDATGPLEEHFKQMPGVDIPGGLFNVLEVLDKDEVEAGGLNEEIFGSDQKDIPGILHRFRTGQALTGKQGIFAGFRRAKRQLGRKLVRLQQIHYGPDVVYRRINEYPAPGFYQPDFEKYDCTPTEGLLTDSQRHLWYLQLEHIRTIFDDAKAVIPLSMLIKAMPIEYKEELMKAIEQAEEEQKQMMQNQLQDKQRLDRLLEAQAAEDISQAAENRAGAALDRIKTLAEAQKLGREPAIELAKMAFEYEMAKIKAKEQSGIKRAKKKAGKK